MKILELEVTNFGSYPKLSLDLSDMGLTLIQGKTGAGKSTIMDAVLWVLYGETAKGLSVDEVKSWNADAPTKGSIILDFEKESAVKITRIRGKANDLYWETAAVPFRGKDLADTQKIINNNILRMDAATFSASAYFNEFSETAQFFLAKAKDRRAMFEKLANLEFPKKLLERISEQKKTVKSTLQKTETEISRVLGQIESTSTQLGRAQISDNNWQHQAPLQVRHLEAKVTGFEQEEKDRIEMLDSNSCVWQTQKQQKLGIIVAQLEKLNEDIKPESFFATKIKKSKTCSKCGQIEIQSEDTDWRTKKIENGYKIMERDQKIEALGELDSSKDPWTAQKRPKENPYVQQLEQERKKVSPYEAQIQELTFDIATYEAKKKTTEIQYGSLTAKLSGLDHLHDLSGTMRGKLLTSAVRSIEETTNDYLERFFDSEFKVAFTLDDDKLDVEIDKSGVSCSYRQLSKGQRGLLKLCFVVSVMSAAANRAGVHFDQIFLDESLDGLDESLKIKAFRLFEELSKNHSSVFVIDHCEAFQNMFTKKFNVSMHNDVSKMEEVE